MCKLLQHLPNTWSLACAAVYFSIGGQGAGERGYSSKVEGPPAEMLAKMWGWNEPERVNVQSVEVKVDAALIEQLRAGYAQLGERSAKACLPLPGGAGVGGRAPAGGYASQELAARVAANSEANGAS
jgi:hypothetical protein